MNLPNLITLSRIPLMFAIVGLMYGEWLGAASLAFWLFIACAVGDWLDGYLARKQGLVSAFGKLMDVATVVTPNTPELEALGGIDAILAHDCHLVLKDGHGSGPRVIDSLLSPTGQQLRILDGKRFDTDDTHGTGCTFASALATELARGRPIDEAFVEAVRFTRIALISAPGFGEGHGPIGHALGHNPYAELED